MGQWLETWLTKSLGFCTKLYNTPPKTRDWQSNSRSSIIPIKGPEGGEQEWSLERRFGEEASGVVCTVNRFQHQYLLINSFEQSAVGVLHIQHDHCHQTNPQSPTLSLRPLNGCAIVLIVLRLRKSQPIKQAASADHLLNCGRSSDEPSVSDR